MVKQDAVIKAKERASELQIKEDISFDYEYEKLQQCEFQPDKLQQAVYNISQCWDGEDGVRDKKENGSILNRMIWRIWNYFFSVYIDEQTNYNRENLVCVIQLQKYIVENEKKIGQLEERIRKLEEV